MVPPRGTGWESAVTAAVNAQETETLPMEATKEVTLSTTRKQLVEDALQAALDGNWEVAIALNQLLIERNPNDAEAYNRVGRAKLALGKVSGARQAYTQALKADPANLIARRNLQRLDQLKDRKLEGTALGAHPMPRTKVFIEEVGKTWVDELVNVEAIQMLAEVFPGEALVLSNVDGRLVVSREDGTRLGEVESKTAERMLSLISSGYRFEVFSLGISGQSLRVILREVYRDPSMSGAVSFPRQITSRSYLRERDMLRSRDEMDFLGELGEDDEEIEEEDSSPSDAYETEPEEIDAEPLIEEAMSLGDEEPES